MYPINSPSGGKIETKSKLMRQIGDVVDLSTFDYQSGRHQLGPNTQIYQRNSIRHSISDQTSVPMLMQSSSPTPSSSSATATNKQHQFEFRSKIQ